MLLLAHGVSSALREIHPALKEAWSRGQARDQEDTRNMDWMEQEMLEGADTMGTECSCCSGVDELLSLS